MSTTVEVLGLGAESSPTGSSSTTAATTISSTVANAIVKTAAIISSTVSTSSTTGASSTTTATPSSTPSPTHTPTQSGNAEEKLSVKDLSQALQHFGVVDYFVFVLMLAVCAVIGVYFGFIEKKQKQKKLAGKDGAGAAGIEERRGSEALDYLVGGRQMKVFPVALSLVASFVSGISLLGTSTEIYVYGTQYAFILVTLAFSGAISWYIFLPVFCNLQLTSTYEYFELRFNKSVRLLGSAFFTGANLIWLPIVIYVPALAFNQVTGINVHVITPIVCLVCIFYTTVGGLKAVVWTDVIQTVVMVGAIIFVIIKGTIDVGGVGVVFQRNFDSGRLEWPEFTLDPRVRMSMLALMVGNVGHNAYHFGCNQVMTQRYMSLPGVKEMAHTSFIFVIGLILLYSLCLYNGLLLYATYYDCDPLTTKLAMAKDQLVPLLVVQSLSSFPGVPGMFVAGIFSAALSSLSTGLNSLAAVFLEDYIKPLGKKPLTEHQIGVTMRLCTVVIGVLSVALVFVVERMGSHVMQLAITIGSVVQGPLLGLFVMGLLCPSINSKSAFAGSVFSFVFMAWLSLSAQLSINSGEVDPHIKPVSVDGCDYEFERPLVTLANATLPDAGPMSLSIAEEFYHISFMLYTVIGGTVGVAVGYIAGFFFGRNNAGDVSLELLSPCILTGINVHVITPIVCLVCIFYTTAGGLKAVVWTDVIQTVVMVGAIFFVIIKGTIDVGGLGVVIQRNLDSGRLEWPELTLDPKVRMSMLALLVGNVAHNSYNLGCNQIIIQRYLSLPGLKEMAQTSFLFIFGLVVLMAVCLYNGLLLYATYYDCDPLTTQLAVAKDQLVPLLVVQSLSSFPGVPGMFVAGVFSAALSSLSTGLNSLAAVFLEDYIKPLVKKPLTEHQIAVTMRLCTVIIGVLSVALVFVVEQMGSHVIQLSMTIGSIAQGPLLALFVMGLLCPSINSKYFQLRYGAGIRNLGSVLFILGTVSILIGNIFGDLLFSTTQVLWLPVVLYVPAITFSQVTGTGIHVITPIVCTICTFYTCVGGLKAVIWTDVIQSFVMFGSILAVCIKGTIDVGGLAVVLQRNNEGGRLNAPEWTWDPTIRLSMLSVVVGGTLHKIQSSDVNQVSIQRFLSLPSYNHAKRCMLIFTLLLMFLLSCCSYMGLVSYAVYHDCDPISTKLATASDQLPSLLMMRTLGSLSGLPGLFVAGVFSAALSSLSTGLNSLACVITQDIVRPLLQKPLTERQTAFWLRAIVVVFGFSCIGMVNVVEKLGTVVPLASSTSAVSMGPLLGIYVMGVCLPWIKGKSVLVGSLVSFLTLAWICANAQLAQMNGDIRHPKLPVSVDGCDYSFDNVTVQAAIHGYSPSERDIYHLSFLWYTAFGGVICIVVSILAGFVFGWEDLTKMDPNLITPCMRRFLPNKNYETYLERRFDRRVRIFGSCLFVVMNVMWQPICLYVPALTLNQVSGINVGTIVPLTSFVCILYTCVGGIKGVVYTDAIQCIVMLGSMAIVIVKGTLDIGGLKVVLERNSLYNRLVGPEMTFDPTARMGVLAVLIGGTLFKLQSDGINQPIVQRYLTLPNSKAVQKALIIAITGFVVIISMCIYIGLMAFAEFYHCDPISTGLARAKDQVIPLYVVKTVGDCPGLVGVFVAGIFSAALSSLSTALNSLSGVILADFVEPFRKKPLTERQTAFILRSVVVAFGLISMASVPIVEKLGLVMQLSTTVAAIALGPLLGAFTVGMLLPFVKTESLLVGISCASSLIAYIAVRAQIAIFTGALTFPSKSVSVEGCDYSFQWPVSSDSTTMTDSSNSTTHGIHEISFLWYTAVGSVGTVVGSLLATFYFGRQDPCLVDKELVSPVVREYWFGKYKSVANDDTARNQGHINA